eukprot:scaffold123217_cov49-Attheya_sp.AAC.5
MVLNFVRVDLSDQEETKPPTAKEIDEEWGSLSSIDENARLFGDEDNESEVDEDEIEIQFDIEAQDELLNAHESQDDAGLTDTGVRDHSIAKSSSPTHYELAKFATDLVPSLLTQVIELLVKNVGSQDNIHEHLAESKKLCLVGKEAASKFNEHWICTNDIWS